VLEYYRIGLYQLAPFGLSKVTQFGLACKAVGATLMIALFRRFFHLAKNGDWLTLQRRKAKDA
jgi:hypothetical protein